MGSRNEARGEILAATEKFVESMNDPTALVHYGTKGMKWGVWNDDTKRKYGIGSMKNAAGDVKSKLASAVSSATAKISANRTAKRQARIERSTAKRQQKAILKAQRKELGMKKKDFDKLRETTLKSHDPRVIAKGMHTLTDDELKTKIKRLQEEDKIAKMASNQQKQHYEALGKKYEALSKNPLVEVGKGAVSSFVNSAVSELGVNLVIKQLAKPVMEQQIKQYAKAAQAQNQKRQEAQVARQMSPYINAAKKQNADYTSTYRSGMIKGYKMKQKPNTSDVSAGKRVVNQYNKDHRNDRSTSVRGYGAKQTPQTANIKAGKKVVDDYRGRVVKGGEYEIPVEIKKQRLSLPAGRG